MWLIYKKYFDVAQNNRLKFNPENFVFVTTSGKILGFMISWISIEINLDKIHASRDEKVRL